MKLDTKLMHDIWYHFLKVKDQAKILCRDKNQNNDYLATMWLFLMGNEQSFWGERNILYLNCGVTYKDVLIFQSQ